MELAIDVLPLLDGGTASNDVDVMSQFYSDMCSAQKYFQSATQRWRQNFVTYV